MPPLFSGHWALGQRASGKLIYARLEGTTGGKQIFEEVGFNTKLRQQAKT